MSTLHSPDAEQLIEISVTITPCGSPQNASYSWSYALPNPPAGVSINPADGTLYIAQKLHGPVRIEYILNSEPGTSSIELVYANLNLSLKDGVTAQITGITIHPNANRITLQFANRNPRRFGVYLIARDGNNPDQAIVSQDPQVTNDPNSQPPTGGH